jgi:hypothetical protein
VAKTNQRINNFDSVVFCWVVACSYHDPYVGFVASLRPQGGNNAYGVNNVIKTIVSVEGICQWSSWLRSTLCAGNGVVMGIAHAFMRNCRKTSGDNFHTGY